MKQIITTYDEYQCHNKNLPVWVYVKITQLNRGNSTLKCNFPNYNIKTRYDLIPIKPDLFFSFNNEWNFYGFALGDKVIQIYKNQIISETYYEIFKYDIYERNFVTNISKQIYHEKEIGMFYCPYIPLRMGSNFLTNNAIT